MSLRHIGVFGGSFNPVHIGHLILAEYILQFGNIDEIWFLLSSLNPLKSNPEELVADQHRLDMLRIAIEGKARMSVCDIELSMPRPSYTINTLERLADQYPDCRFSLIIGADNWCVFDQWREHDKIINRFSPIVYPRQGYDICLTDMPENVTMINAPIIEISSTFIRRIIKQGLDPDVYLPYGVGQYISANHIYKE